MATQKVIVIFVWFPFMERDYLRYGVEFWEKLGFKVYVFDFSEIRYPQALGKKSFLPNVMADSFIYKIHSIFQFKSLLDKINRGDTTVIINSFRNTGTIAEYINLLVDMPLRVIAVNPSSHLPLDRYGLRSQFANAPMQTMLKLITPQRAYSMAAKCIGRLIPKIPETQNHVKPDIVFVSCEAERRAYEGVVALNDCEVVPSHTHDVDLFNATKRTTPTERTHCLFLDEAMNSNHQRQIVGDETPPINLETYFASLRRFFDLIEQKTGLPVVIALHPRAIYKDVQRFFGGRKVYEGVTAELAALSKFVVVHRSSSFGYAVMNKIPILFTVTNELCDTSKTLVYGQCRTYASELGNEVINIDLPNKVDDIDFDSLPMNLPLYRAYFRNYLSMEKDPRMTLWDKVYDATFQRSA